MPTKVVPIGIVVPAWLRAELESIATARRVSLATVLREMLTDGVLRAHCERQANTPQVADAAE